jgi:integrase/recombinase XerC
MSPAALEWLAGFRRHLAIERRLSAHTDSNYARDLAALVKYCDRHRLQDWGALDSQHVRTFAAHSHAAGLAPRSIQRRLSAVRSFCNYLVRERALPGNPAYEIRAPKAGRRLPHTLDADQMAHLLNAPPGDALLARDHALVELLYSSGLRLAELVGIDLADLDLKDRTVRVLGKGRKSRIIPVGSKAVQALERWLQQRSAMVKAGEMAMFIGRNGRRLGAPRAWRARAPAPLQTFLRVPSA